MRNILDKKEELTGSSSIKKEYLVKYKHSFFPKTALSSFEEDAAKEKGVKIIEINTTECYAMFEGSEDSIISLFSYLKKNQKSLFDN